MARPSRPGKAGRRTASIALTDIDDDGDLDALVTNGRHWAEQNYLFFNDGHGGFKTARRIGEWLDGSYAIGGADLNDDGFQDIAVVNDKTPNRIYWASASGAFDTASTFGDPAAASRSLEIADMDDDGDRDLVIANRKAANEILLNDGKGGFEETLRFGSESSQTIQARAIDINNDGQVDLVTAERGAARRQNLARRLHTV